MTKPDIEIINTHDCDPAECCNICHDEEIARLQRLRERLIRRNVWGEVAKVDAALADDRCKCGCW